MLPKRDPAPAASSHPPVFPKLHPGDVGPGRIADILQKRLSDENGTEIGFFGGPAPLQGLQKGVQLRGVKKAKTVLKCANGPAIRSYGFQKILWGSEKILWPQKSFPGGVRSFN